MPFKIFVTRKSLQLDLRVIVSSFHNGAFLLCALPVCLPGTRLGSGEGRGECLENKNAIFGHVPVLGQSFVFFLLHTLNEITFSSMHGISFRVFLFKHDKLESVDMFHMKPITVGT